MRKNHPESQIISDPIEIVQARSLLKLQGHTTLISEIEPKHTDETMQYENWVKAMQKELDQFQKIDVWKLVELPKDKKVVGAKWVFKNKLDENGMVVRNKARLVAKGYSQQEGINYKENYKTQIYYLWFHKN